MEKDCLRIKAIELLAALILLSLTTSSASAIQTTYSVIEPAWPPGIDFYEPDNSLVDGSTFGGNLTVRKDAGATVLVLFNITGDADFTSFTVDSSNGMTVVDFAGIENVSATHTLYVRNTLGYGVYACPSATSIGQVTAYCAGRVVFTHAECAAATAKSGLTCSISGSDYLVDGMSGSGLAENTEAGDTTVNLDYGLDSGVRRAPLEDGSGVILTYNVRAGTYPHVYEESSGRLDLMLVNTPPSITDTYDIFNYSQIKGEVAWAALTLNLSARNATIVFGETVDFTNVDDLNLDRDVNLSFNYVEVNTTSMTAFNKTATITLRSLSFQAVRILKDGADCADCVTLSYEGGEAVFTVEPGLSNYRAAEIAGWVNWNVIDLASHWIGSTADNRGVILVGNETGAATYRQYYSSNASDPAYAPRLEMNYTLRSITMYNNLTLSGAYDLDDYFWDMDQDTLTFQTSNDHPNILITIHDSDHTVDIMPLNNWYGTEYVVFTASDGRGGAVDSNNVTLYVVEGVTTTTTATTTSNAPPVVGGITGDNPIILVAGGYKTVQYNVSVSDEDGCDDLNYYGAVIWDDDAAEHNDPENNNRLYRNNTCSLTCNGYDGLVSCNFRMIYYSAASNSWAVNVTVDDGSAAGYNVTWNVNVSSLAAVNLTSQTINFSAGAPGGRLNLSQITTWDTQLSVQNLGNTEEDMLVSGTDMACSLGAIPAGNVKYHSSSGLDYTSGGMCALTGNNADTCDPLKVDFNLPKTSDGIPSTKNVYWKLRIPDGGVSGSCNGTLTAGGWLA